MASIVIDYDILSKVSSHSSNLAKKAENYANDLTNKVANSFSGISGGSSTQTTDASYYVSQKIKALKNKYDDFVSFASQVTSLSETAKRVDGEVEAMLINNQEVFLKGHENLRIEGWKAGIINWLVDLKNSCPLFEIIGEAIQMIGTGLSDMLANIKYWYKCEGGKQIVDLVLAIGGAIVAVMLFIAAIPASTFVAICAAIGAAISVINAVTNVVTSGMALYATRSGDPAWAQIYGKQDKLSDVFRQTNFGNGFTNRLSYLGATLIDSAELFCEAVNIVNTLSKIKSKFGFINNYFDKKTGLFSYMSEVAEVNERGIAKTKYTPQSVWKGLKAFVADKPMSGSGDKGIRTLLKNNLKIDFSDFKNSFSITGFKDTFRYYKENKSALGTLLFSKDASKVGNAKEYYNIFTSKGLKNTATTIKSGLGFAEKLNEIYNGSFDLRKEYTTKVFGLSDIVTKSNKLGITKIIGNKLGWQYTSDGIWQKAQKQWELSTYITYGY